MLADGWLPGQATARYSKNAAGQADRLRAASGRHDCLGQEIEYRERGSETDNPARQMHPFGRRMTS